MRITTWLKGCNDQLCMFVSCDDDKIPNHYYFPFFFQCTYPDKNISMWHCFSIYSCNSWALHKILIYILECLMMTMMFTSTIIVVTDIPNKNYLLSASMQHLWCYISLMLLLYIINDLVFFFIFFFLYWSCRFSCMVVMCANVKFSKSVVGHTFGLLLMTMVIFCRCM